jgi:hypothetical protein
MKDSLHIIYQMTFLSKKINSAIAKGIKEINSDKII